MQKTPRHPLLWSLLAAAFAALVFIPAVPRAEAASLPITAASIQAAFQSVRDSLAHLLAAKDDRRIDELRFRINAYREILRFTTTEIQDFRIQLGALPPTATTTATTTIPETPQVVWHRASLAGFEKLAAFVEQEQAWLDIEEGILSLDGIRERAGMFQKWRETSYQVVAEPVREYLLIERQTTVVDTATRRLKKIDEDVKKLQRARVRGAADLAKQLAEAESLVGDAAKLEAEARHLFIKANFEPAPSATTTSSTVPLSTPEDSGMDGTAATGTIATSTAATATSSDSGATSTAPLPPAGEPEPSPKELIRQSLEKIQAAYQQFLKMSTAVQGMLSR